MAIFNHYLLKAYENGILSRLDLFHNGQPDIKIGLNEPEALGISNVMFPFSLLATSFEVSATIAVHRSSVAVHRSSRSDVLAQRGSIVLRLWVRLKIKNVLFKHKHTQQWAATQLKIITSIYCKYIHNEQYRKQTNTSSDWHPNYVEYKVLESEWTLANGDIKVRNQYFAYF